MLFNKFEIFKNELIMILLYTGTGIAVVILVSEYFILKWLQTDLVMI